MTIRHLIPDLAADKLDFDLTWDFVGLNGGLSELRAPRGDALNVLDVSSQDDTSIRMIH